VGGFMPTPYAASYAASKFGARALTDSLRQEVRDAPGIRVCGLYPYFVDTPGVEHGANYTGARLKPAPFVLDVDTVAEALVHLAEHPRAEWTLGLPAKLGKVGHRVAPRVTEWGLARGMEAWFAIAPDAPLTDGSLHETMPETERPAGGWRHDRLRGVAALAGLAAAGFGLATALRSRRAY
jgi:hypothetical protein